MPIYPPRPDPFECAICGRTVELGRWEYAGRYPIKPVCRNCADMWGKGIGGWNDLNRDRRTLRLVSALAEALMAEAWRAQHRDGGRHARA